MVSTELDFLLGISFMFSFFIALIIFGLPTQFQLLTGFDFAWFGGGIVAITTGCVVLTGIPCAILEASYGIITIMSYVGLSALINPELITAIDIIKAFIMTPLSIALIYVISRLARGGG